MYTEWTYAIYLIISFGLTIWVARTLYRNGKAFLLEAFHGNEDLADSVNHLLVVGFYLINIGYVALALKYGNKPSDLRSAIEILSTKVGLVCVVLGLMHFMNLLIFTKMRQSGLIARFHQPLDSDLRPEEIIPPVVA